MTCSATTAPGSTARACSSLRREFARCRPERAARLWSVASTSRSVSRSRRYSSRSGPSQLVETLVALSRRGRLLRRGPGTGRHPPRERAVAVATGPSCSRATGTWPRTPFRFRLWERDDVRWWFAAEHGLLLHARGAGASCLRSPRPVARARRYRSSTLGASSSAPQRRRRAAGERRPTRPWPRASTG